MADLTREVLIRFRFDEQGVSVGIERTKRAVDGVATSTGALGLAGRATVPVLRSMAGVALGVASGMTAATIATQGLTPALVHAAKEIGDTELNLLRLEIATRGNVEEFNRLRAVIAQRPTNPLFGTGDQARAVAFAKVIGLTTDQIEAAFPTVRAFAALMGTSLPEAFDAFGRAAITGNNRALQTIGLVIRQRDLQEQALTTYGKTFNALTVLEQQQVRVNTVIEKGAFALEAEARVAETMPGSLKRLQVASDDLIESFVRWARIPAILETLSLGIGGFSQQAERDLDAQTKALDNLHAGWIEFEQFMSRVRFEGPVQAAKHAKEAVAEWRKQLEETRLIERGLASGFEGMLPQTTEDTAKKRADEITAAVDQINKALEAQGRTVRVNARDLETFAAKQDAVAFATNELAEAIGRPETAISAFVADLEARARKNADALEKAAKEYEAAAQRLQNRFEAAVLRRTAETLAPLQRATTEAAGIARGPEAFGAIKPQFESRFGQAESPIEKRLKKEHDDQMARLAIKRRAWEDEADAEVRATELAETRKRALYGDTQTTTGDLLRERDALEKEFGAASVTRQKEITDRLIELDRELHDTRISSHLDAAAVIGAASSTMFSSIERSFFSMYSHQVGAQKNLAKIFGGTFQLMTAAVIRSIGQQAAAWAGLYAAHAIGIDALGPLGIGLSKGKAFAAAAKFAAIAGGAGIAAAALEAAGQRTLEAAERAEGPLRSVSDTARESQRVMGMTFTRPVENLTINLGVTIMGQLQFFGADQRMTMRDFYAHELLHLVQESMDSGELVNRGAR